jgi:hypothetical protein
VPGFAFFFVDDVTKMAKTLRPMQLGKNRISIAEKRVAKTIHAEFIHSLTFLIVLLFAQLCLCLCRCQSSSSSVSISRYRSGGNGSTSNSLNTETTATRTINGLS